MRPLEFVNGFNVLEHTHPGRFATRELFVLDPRALIFCSIDGWLFLASS